MAIELATAALPAYYRDILRLSQCPGYADSMAWKKGPPVCPFLGGTNYMGHEEVTELLKEVPAWHVAGKIERKNDLGYLELSDQAFRRTGSIGLGYDVLTHRRQRPHVQRLLRRLPGRGGMLQEAHAFLDGRDQLELPLDAARWWQQVMWRHCLGKEISWEEASAIIEFRDAWVVASVATLGEFSISNVTFSLGSMNDQQDKYYQQIRELLRGEVPEDVLDLVAQGMLEAFCFAGGISVPTSITSATAALFQDFMMEPVTEENVVPFVYEVTRLFPAVQGFPYWDKDGHRHIAYLNGALRDPNAWGPDSNRFTLKDVNLYREKHCGFANQAVGENAGDSKYCPGMDAALAVCQAFVLVLGTWAKKGQRLESIWRPKEPIKPAHKPTWWCPFTLERLRGEDISLFQIVMDSKQSGEALLQNLGPEKLTAIFDRCDADRDGVPDALAKMDVTTRLYQWIAVRLYEDASSIEHVEVPRQRALGAFSDSNSVRLSIVPGADLRLPYFDEVWDGLATAGLQRLGCFALKHATAMMDADEISDDLLVTTLEQRQEAVVMGQQAFVNQDNVCVLPVTKHPFPDLMSDEGQVGIAFSGIGQHHLRRNTNAEHEQYGELVCDPGSDVLAALPLRGDCFETLGAAAYFKREEGGGYKITAIDWKAMGKIFLPDEGKDWERAKFVWRCSLIVYVTVVDHLVETHWLRANALATSLREALGPDHPIRRLMHVNIYNTARVNQSAYQTLYAEHGLLHRASCFAYDGLEAAFKHGAERFTYTTWPQRYEQQDLPEDLKKTLPIWEDGLPLWEAMREFYAGYVDLYYANDAAVQADKELVAYWEFKSVPMYTKSLPPLSKAALVDQLTQAAFDVTAFHEYIGHVVAYVTDPGGCHLKVRKGQCMADLQHMMKCLSLVASTGIMMPLFMADWTYLLDLSGTDAPANKFQEAKALWAKMQDRLTGVAEAIQERNQTRFQPCSAFDPRTFECSVNL